MPTSAIDTLSEVQAFTQLLDSFMNETDVNAHFKIKKQLLSLKVQPNPALSAALHQFIKEQTNTVCGYLVEEISFEQGLWPTWDPAAAARCYHAAADKAHPRGRNALGVCYQYGRGVDKDLTKAAQLYKLAADQGSALAQCNLGVCYEYGHGVAKDLTKAVQLYKLAADQGFARAQCNLGTCYYNSYSVEKDLTKAAQLYQLAADQGLAQAQCNLGVCYRNGYGVAKDLTKAAQLYQLAADQGLAQAQCNLGICYQNGYGVAKDLTQVAQLYQLAADQGFAWAQCHLGVCYEYGQGVDKNIAKALALYALVMAQEVESGKRYLGNCLRSLKDDYVQRENGFPRDAACVNICQQLITDVDNNKSANAEYIARLFHTPQDAIAVRFHDALFRQDVTELAALYQQSPATVAKLFEQFEASVLLACDAPESVTHQWFMAQTFTEPSLCILQDQKRANQVLKFAEAEALTEALTQLDAIQSPACLTEDAVFKIASFLFDLATPENTEQPELAAQRALDYLRTKPEMKGIEWWIDSCLYILYAPLKRLQNDQTKLLPLVIRKMFMASSEKMEPEEITEALQYFITQPVSTPQPVVELWSLTLGRMQQPVVQAPPQASRKWVRL